MRVILDDVMVHQSVIGVLDQFELFKSVLPEIDKVLLHSKKSEWFDLLDWLSVCETIQIEFGSASVFFLGQKVLLNSNWPDSISTLEEALFSINEAYKNTHKFGKIGYYECNKKSNLLYEITCTTPYSDNFNLGLIKGLSNHFDAGGVKAWIDYTKSDIKVEAEYEHFYKIKIQVILLNEKDYLNKINHARFSDNWINDKDKLMDQLLYEMIKTFANVTNELRARSIKDTLTGLNNRQYFEYIIKDKLAYFNRYGDDMTLIIADIDFFKVVNDKFGHQVGDEVLKTVAYLSKSKIRATDIITRWGGEEFAILLCNTDCAFANELATKIKNRIEKYKFVALDGENITASFGISQVKKEDSVNDWFKRADDALYEAKQNGRNSICIQ